MNQHKADENGRNARGGKMTNHTQGPWTIDDRDPAPFIEIEGIVNGKKRVLAVIQGGLKNDLPLKANANLIAAAPELLAACKQAHDLLDELDGRGMANVVVGPAKAKLWLAIQKARP